MIARLENIYLNGFRYVLIALASLIIVFAVGLLIVASLNILAEPEIDRNNRIDVPDWNKQRFLVLPIVPRTERSDLGLTKELDDSTSRELRREITVDSRVLLILKNLDELFEDPERINFSISNSPKIFQEWVNNSGVEKSDYSVFLDGLVKYSADVRNERRLQQLGNAEARLALVEQAIMLYRDAFITNKAELILRIRRQIEQAEASAELKRLEGFSQLIRVGYAFIAFSSVIFVLLIFKVEVNLRAIAPALLQSDNPDSADGETSQEG